MPSLVSNQPIKMYYRLEEQTAIQSLSEISKFTEGFSEKYNYDEQFVLNLNNSLNTPDKKILKGFLNTPKDINIMKQVIGKKGCYFHLTTTNCNIEFIWYDKKSNKVYFWGNKFELIKAMNIIKHRITIVSERASTES